MNCLLLEYTPGVFLDDIPGLEDRDRRLFLEVAVVSCSVRDFERVPELRVLGPATPMHGMSMFPRLALNNVFPRRFSVFKMQKMTT